MEGRNSREQRSRRNEVRRIVWHPNRRHVLTKGGTSGDARDQRYVNGKCCDADGVSVGMRGPLTPCYPGSLRAVRMNELFGGTRSLSCGSCSASVSPIELRTGISHANVRCSVVRASDFKSEDLYGFEPLVGQGEDQVGFFNIPPNQLLCRLVCA